MVATQRSFDELGTPLSEVTFCVIDLETTGGSPQGSAITEIGALKVLRGEVVGTFHTLVDPRTRVPPAIRLLTGIDDALLAGAPPIGAVLPSFLEFVRDAVLLAHNARFDVGFLDAALARASYPRLANRVVCTARLARRILAGEVPNHKLSTLTERLRCAHRPEHRAFADVLATTDLLHHLIERVAGFGVTTLDDLLAMSATRVDGTFSKITLARDLPRAPGVYRFVSAGGTTLYIGKATDLRARVRSYFYGDPRSKIRNLLRETQAIETDTYATMLEAEIAEARAIASERPRYNGTGKRSGTWYLKLAVQRAVPRLHACRVPKDDGGIYIGPFVSGKAVRILIDACRSALPVHRCTEPRTCLLTLAQCITDQPDRLLDALERRMASLAAQERFEEAAELRDGAAALERALVRRAEVHALVAAGDLLLEVGGRALLVRAGRLAGARPTGGDTRRVVTEMRAEAAESPSASFLTPDVQRETAVICSWLRRGREDARLVWTERPWALPVAARPSLRFAPAAATR
ncbi:MAG: exonuclease domain-containing protein [Actinomycetota bacterium]